jgi:hypothetical protein
MTTIWIHDWELGDEGAVVTVGDALDWLVCTPDATTLQLASDRGVDLHMSPERLWGYGHPALGVRGTVEGVEAVMCDLRRTPLGAETVPGSEVLVPARSTNERWWELCRDHALSGFLVTLGDAVLSTNPATEGRSEWHSGTGPMPSSSPPPASPRWMPPLDADALRLLGDRPEGVVMSPYVDPPASRCAHPAHPARPPRDPGP